MKSHLKRIATPKTWNVARKEYKFITRQKPGAHSAQTSMPLNIILRDVLRFAKTTKEAKFILTKKEVLVDGKRKKDIKAGVGIMDVLTIPELKKNYRAIITQKNKLDLVAIPKEEAEYKICKITGKTIVRGKTQINLNDGRSILSEKKEYKTGDSLLIKLPSQEITKHFPLKEGCAVYLTAGEHIGSTGIFKESKEKTAIVSVEGIICETPKKFLFVIGDSKPAIDTSWSRK